MQFREEIGPILYGETRTLSFDFTDELAPGETLVTPVWSASVYSGTDASPNGIFFSISTTTGNVVTQRVRPNSTGNIYVITCTTSTSAGNVLAKVGILAVPPSV